MSFFSLSCRWFENDVLKATLATDAVIGAMASPRTPGSAYVLLVRAGEGQGRSLAELSDGAHMSALFCRCDCVTLCAFAPLFGGSRSTT